MWIWSGPKEDTIMKMPIKKSIKRFLVAGILVSVGLPVIIVGGKKLIFYSSTQVHTFFTPEQATVIMHGIENKELSKRIDSFVSNQIIKKSLLSTSPTDLIIMLSDAFPVLKSVTYQYQPPKTIVFTLEGTKPACLVNDHWVIGNHRTLVDKKSFTDETLAGLPRISIDKKWLINTPLSHPYGASFDELRMSGGKDHTSNTKTKSIFSVHHTQTDSDEAAKPLILSLSKDASAGRGKAVSSNAIPRHLYNFIHKLTPYHWQNFAITYHAPWNIELIPHKSICKASIIVTEHTLFNAKKITAISPIFKDLCSKGIITKKVLEAKHCPLVFDTRIKDQVIVRCNQPAKRGRGHG